MSQSTCAVIVANECDEKQGGSVCTPFLFLDKRPILAYALDAITRCSDIESIVVAIPKERAEAMLHLVRMYGYAKIRKIVAVGPRRAGALAAALAHVPGDAEILCLVDPLRPLVTPALLSATVRTAARHGSAAAGTEITSRVVRVKHGVPHPAPATDGGHLWTLFPPLAVPREPFAACIAAAAKRRGSFADDLEAVFAAKLLPRPVSADAAPFAEFRVRSNDDIVPAIPLLRSQGLIS